ncbi:28 kDa heat-and acid-stable phosphoprotein OS=Homo sapiens GN=PDAP1 PE=1 SV=1 [Rhizoctonia solani AG-1 IB]|uniref:28 kDa heat-and acid-stable phosphoprotein n=1 Tax=Thanatephorus cucumeris (strain AG1-IB / isolate 7/3/14) TaxID=1108050 RepID=M5BYC1_THACB|nr:28 kDa heat-and acid-stable phosphoprotein AltName: Full=PDGF-associated protein [Rhizoctonia solani AG-1 IB]CEL57122.1 28 kDa heat-and acid-stable phosphoprotein OS=Homo sapiens GN=PDAP1 PE=1 SV=1 [Rhizoctonia solani AG-1 IB]
MVRGSGKFKQKRGGGRSFSRDMVLDSDGVASGTDPRANRRKKLEQESDEDDEDESGEEEEEDDDEEEESDGAGPSELAQPEMTRAERKALKKQQGTKQKGKGIGTIKEGSEEGSEDDSDLINPNRVPMKNLSISDVGAPRELSRREREAKEKKEAEDRYWKLHVQGKTDKAKSDLARLAKIRAEREVAAARRKQEAEERAAEADKKAAERQSRR